MPSASSAASEYALSSRIARSIKGGPEESLFHITPSNAADRAPVHQMFTSTTTSPWVTTATSFGFALNRGESTLIG